MGKKVQPTYGTGTQKLRDTPMPSLTHSGSLSASATPHQNLKDFNTLPAIRAQSQVESWQDYCSYIAILPRTTIVI